MNVLSIAWARSPGEAVSPLLILFAGIAFFAVVRSGTVAREFAREGAPILISILGLAVGAVGIVQHFFGLPAVSTEGNTNYSGALAGMLLPVTLAFAAGGRDVVRRAVPAAAAAALFVLLLLTQSRGGWLGAI